MKFLFTLKHSLSFSLKTQTQLDYEKMMFFDDEQRNINDVSKLGVVSILVQNGVSRDDIEKGMQEFISQRS